MCRQIVDDLVDFALGAHVDAAGRFIHNQNVGVRVEPLAHDDLLLVAAGQVSGLLAAGGRLDADFLNVLVGQLVFPLAAGERAPADGRQVCRHDIGLDGKVKRQALSSAVLRQKRDAVLLCLRGVVDFDLLPADVHVAALDIVHAEDRAHDLGSARADQAGNPQHLAAAQAEGNVLLPVFAAQMLHAENLIADDRVPRGIGAAHFPADHHLHELGGGDGRHVARADDLTVAHHRDGLADFKDLLHAVGDVYNRNAAFLQITNDVKQRIEFILRQCRGGLIHQDDSGVPAQRLRDLHHLFFGDGQ